MKLLDQEATIDTPLPSEKQSSAGEPVFTNCKGTPLSFCDAVYFPETFNACFNIFYHVV
jgi:hypothetical protein